MPKIWKTQPHDAARINELARVARIPAVVAQLLLARGIQDSRAAAEFLDPKLSGLRDPELLPGVPAAASLILQAIQARRKIVVYGDYDVDGMTASAIMLLCLRLLGAEASSYVPNRVDEGYGLHEEALRNLAARGAQCVITVDCGVASIHEAQVAKELGLELIITDHHELAESLPGAAAIVHPRLPGTDYPFSGLCGAGVALKLAWALCQEACQAKRVTEPMRNFLLTATGLAALGTIADVVPLLDENRVLVKHGLTALWELPTPGIKALLTVTKLHEQSSISTEDIAFKIAPRLNAAGRLGQASLGVELLMTDSQARATALAEYLNELNGSRDSIERSVYLSANKQAQQFDPENSPALVLADKGWHVGIIGIVAARLAEKFHRPVLMISLDDLGLKPGVGSGRSVPGFDLHAALSECDAFTLTFGGHAAAAGFKIEPDKIEAFRAAFCDAAAAQLSQNAKLPELTIDAEVALGALTEEAVRQIERLAPFGQGNRRPIVCATQVELAAPPKKIGNDRHLQLQIQQHGVKMRGVAFSGGEWADELAAIQGPFAIAFRPVINEFRGRRTVEFQLCDWHVGTPSETEKGLAHV